MLQGNGGVIEVNPSHGNEVKHPAEAYIASLQSPVSIVIPLSQSQTPIFQTRYPTLRPSQPFSRHFYRHFLGLGQLGNNHCPLPPLPIMPVFANRSSSEGFAPPPKRQATCPFGRIGTVQDRSQMDLQTTRPILLATIPGNNKHQTYTPSTR